MSWVSTVMRAILPLSSRCPTIPGARDPKPADTESVGRNLWYSLREGPFSHTRTEHLLATFDGIDLEGRGGFSLYFRQAVWLRLRRLESMKMPPIAIALAPTPTSRVMSAPVNGRAASRRSRRRHKLR